jgi:hypothetical protein
MSEYFKNLPIRIVAALGVMACSSIAYGQTPASGTAGQPLSAGPDQAAVAANGDAVQSKNYFLDRRQVSFAITYENAGANLTFASPVTFQAQGGGLEASVQFRNGFAGVGSIHGFHTNESGHGVPVNVLVEAFGPRYTFQGLGKKYPVNIFLQGLIGEANGFAGLYPNSAGALANASSFASEAGGGMDISCTPHVSVRLFQVDWVRTNLPNATSNVQNTLRLGIGLVLHTRHSPVAQPTVK